MMPDKDGFPTVEEWLKEHPTDGSEDAINEEVSEWLNERTHYRNFKNIKTTDINKQHVQKDNILE